MKMLLSTTLYLAAAIVTSSNLYSADQPAPSLDKIPPRLGEILKKGKQSQSHDVLLLTRTTGTKVPVLTRTETPDRISVKRIQSKAASCENLTERIQEVTRQRSTATQSPPRKLEKKHVHFSQSPTTHLGKSQTQQALQIQPSIDKTRFFIAMAIVIEHSTLLKDNKSALIALMQQRIPLKQHGYTYTSHCAWRKLNCECVQFLIAENNKEKQVAWYMRPHIALLHTHQGISPFNMSTPLAKIHYKDEWIYLKKVFTSTLLFPEKSYFKKPYATNASWNKDTNSVDITVLKRNIILHNEPYPSKKILVTPQLQGLIAEIETLYS